VFSLSLFAQNPLNMNYTFPMLNGNQTAREVPLRFQFMKSEKVDCFGRQLIQLKVSSVTVFEIIVG